jgi:hypothetical protein
MIPAIFWVLGGPRAAGFARPEGPSGLAATSERRRTGRGDDLCADFDQLLALGRNRPDPVAPMQP